MLEKKKNLVFADDSLSEKSKEAPEEKLEVTECQFPGVGAVGTAGGAGEREVVEGGAV